MPEKTGEKQNKGRFQLGRSGNPAGRPRGSLNKVTLAAQALLDGEAEAITRKAVEMALAGDAVALRLCLERIAPARKERPLDVRLPKLGKAEHAARASAAIVAAVAKGELLPGEEQALAGLVEAHRKVLETAELERRVAELEARRGRDESEEARSAARGDGGQGNGASWGHFSGAARRHSGSPADVAGGHPREAVQGSP